MTGRRYLLAEGTIDAGDLDDLVAWLRTDPWLTQGELVREFERCWAEWAGVGRAVFVNSGSSANLLMYDALLVSGRLGNRKVVVPAVSWATTVAPAIQLGFEPIMCDAEMGTLGYDLEQLERLLAEHRPAAVVVVHVLGVPNDMAPLVELGRRYDFFLMEDACAATGSRYDGRPIGTFGEIATFSFFYGHHLSTIEGGMVCTDDEDLHDVLVHLRSHGWGKDADPGREAARARRYGVSEFNRPFTFYYPGFNLRASDLAARIGLSQLRKADEVVRRRAENHRVYQSRFASAPGFHCQQNPRALISSISFAALASSAEHRDRVAAALRAADVETRPIGGGNMSRQPFWADRYGSRDFPVADAVHQRGFQLPNHPGIATRDVDFICDTVLAVPPEPR